MPLKRLLTYSMQSQGVMAMMRHYIGNEGETGRQWTSSNIDDRYVVDLETKLKGAEPLMSCMSGHFRMPYTRAVFPQCVLTMA